EVGGHADDLLVLEVDTEEDRRHVGVADATEADHRRAALLLYTRQTGNPPEGLPRGPKKLLARATLDSSPMPSRLSGKTSRVWNDACRVCIGLYTVTRPTGVPRCRACRAAPGRARRRARSGRARRASARFPSSSRRRGRSPPAPTSPARRSHRSEA